MLHLTRICALCDNFGGVEAPLSLPRSNLHISAPALMARAGGLLLPFKLPHVS
jgi:hypothetical protein